ncbi:phospholipase D-like domain-containing protein [Archangium sp.]|uniref:phospholipase D-like domain-containing protein n=1 Tax=Archangium sp. TaxID=1872627 RepID=UPI002D68AC84|nr:phospholipase D-like domain-containing protein [Archangium sp.]HYO52183.1 phospholipase D-like domain-containing protein [Archangium sp.]
MAHHQNNVQKRLLLGTASTALLVGCVLGVAACGGEPAAESGERELGVSRQEITSVVKIPNGTQTIWAHFTAADPNTAPDYTIRTEIVRLINSQVANGTIQIAIHKLGADISNALIVAARDRNVVVRAAVTGQIAGDTHVSQLKAQLDACSARGCGLVICSGGTYNKTCNWSGTNDSSMHEKFITFTGTTQPGSTLVEQATWIGSANFEGESLYQRGNNSLTFYNATSMNSGMNTHFSHLYAQTRTTDYRSGTRGYFNATGVGTEVFMSNDADGDAPTEVLRRYTGATGCRVRVMMSQIHRTAPLVELLRLKNQGCYVYIGVGGDDAPAVSAEAREYLRVNFPGAQWLRGCHDKSVAIYAKNSSGVFGYYTIAGSHNWTTSALRENDELLTVTNNQAVHDAYYLHFNDLWSKGTPLN